VKCQKTIVEEFKLQNHIEHLWKNPKFDPLHFERACFAHFPLDCSVFYRLDLLSGGLQNCSRFQREQTMEKRVVMIQYR